jgi:subtilisin family serine protease
MGAYKIMPSYEINFIKNDIEKTNFNLMLSDIPEQWRITKGANIKIGILDSGVPNHKDLIENIVDAKNFTDSNSIDDREGHATLVCGIIAANSKDCSGLVGIAPDSKLCIGKTLDDSGSGRDSTLANGIRWCVDIGCDIINMSVGAPASAEKRFSKTREAIKYANSKNVFTFAAAGNEGKRGVSIPAKWNEVFCIVAIDKDKNLAKFSNTGPEVDFCGVGSDVVSTYLQNTYASASGTSFASPAVSAISALIISEHKDGKHKDTPINNFWDLRAHLIKLATTIGEPPWNEHFGFGNIVFDEPDNPVDPYNKTYGIVNEVTKKWWEKLAFWR